jgi:hypothetical protein
VRMASKPKRGKKPPAFDARKSTTPIQWSMDRLSDNRSRRRSRSACWYSRYRLA